MHANASRAAVGRQYAKVKNEKWKRFVMLGTRVHGWGGDCKFFGRGSESQGVRFYNVSEQPTMSHWPVGYCEKRD